MRKLNIDTTSSDELDITTSKMVTPGVLIRECHVSQDSVANELYERTVGLIFEKEDDKARLEVRCCAGNGLEVYQVKNTPVVGSANGTAEPLSGGLLEHDDSCGTSTLDASVVAMPRPAHLTILDLDLAQLRYFIQVRLLS